MPQPGEPGWPGTGERVLPDSEELGTPPDLFGSDLAHLFDYCRALIGQDAEAARTARSVLDSAHEPLSDRERRRAWLFGLARSLAVAVRLPPGSDEPSYMPSALIAASSQETDSGAVRAFRALTDRDREVLDLVYRHGIRPADLPAVLIVPAEEVYRCLAIAEDEFIRLAAGPEAGPVAGLEDIAALPLAVLPAAESGERHPQARPAGQLEDAVLRRPPARRRMLLAVAAVISVAAIVWALVYLAAPGHPAASQGAAVQRRGASSAGQPHAGRSARATHSSAPGQPGHRGAPVASPTPDPVLTPAASPAGLVNNVKPVPCPPGTRATLRWHYTASGSPGGWSGPATLACPGSLTAGPQAMGNLQITPGTTLQAGYDLSVPGNKNSLTMTVSAARVTFAVSCVSKAAPSAPTFTVPLQTGTYQITNDQWFPSGDQNSPLVYQGSVSVPTLCGLGGMISLAKGGTFTATLG